MKSRSGKMNTKNVKMLTAIAFMIVFCFTLSACDPSSYRFANEDLAEVTSIELIKYDNPEQKYFSTWIPDYTSDLKAFDNDKMSSLETLDESRLADFVDDLCGCNILYKYFAYDSPNGTCIKLNYSNGNFLIVWSNYEKDSFSGYIGIFSPVGEVAEFIGCFESIDSYKKLVNDYFHTKI